MRFALLTGILRGLVGFCLLRVCSARVLRHPLITGVERDRCGSLCSPHPTGATGNAANLVNEIDEDVVYLEIVTGRRGDEALYPDDDLQARQVDGLWRFFHKGGSHY